jgi:hypothetical protein
MTDTPWLRAQAIYLGKVVAGLLALFGLGSAAVFLKTMDLSESIRNVVLAALVLASLMIPVFVRAVYRGMDELQKRLHERACMFSLGITFAVAFVAAILEIHRIVPPFSPFWICACIGGGWGLGLALADREFN